MKRSFPLACACALALVVAAPASAADNGKYRTQTGVFDPDRTGIVDAQWKTKIGLSDAGNSNHGLLLQKNGPTATNAAAGAAILGVEGKVGLSVLGYDHRRDTYCGAGSPRYNVSASDGFHFVGGCANGTKAVSSEDAAWDRVTFDTTNPAQAFPPIAPGATIFSVTLISDEQGGSLVDNLNIDGSFIQKPGNSK